MSTVFHLTLSCLGQSLLSDELGSNLMELWAYEGRRLQYPPAARDALYYINSHVLMHDDVCYRLGFDPAKSKVRKRPLLCLSLRNPKGLSMYSKHCKHAHGIAPALFSILPRILGKRSQCPRVYPQ
eukprot:scaffold7016_cov42-Prasinocladus_malaysianus.AAC.1